MSIFCQVLAQLGIYYTHSLDFTFVMMVILGMTHSSKNIVSLNHILEMTPGQQDKNPKEMLSQGLTPIKYFTSRFSVRLFLTIESSYVMVIAFTY